MIVNYLYLMEMLLNEKQFEAAKMINCFLEQSILPVFYLMGYAGTGKTFLIGHVIKDLFEKNLIDQIYVCAPTHQALNVIESSIKSNWENKIIPNKIIFMTIHKLLEFKPIIMTNDGSKIFKSIKESKFLKEIKQKLIIIDECSMISKQMVIELEKYVQLYPLKIIFMGDRKQLPPIGEPESLVFTKIPSKYQYSILLDQIMRTKSPEIKEICKIIRSWDKKENLINLFLPIHNKKTKFFRMYHKKEDYKKSNWFKYMIKKINDNQIPIVLPWKNDTVNYYNNIIREHIYKTNNLTNFILGDYVIFNNFYRSIGGESFYTSNMVKILEISEKECVISDWQSLYIVDAKNKTEKSFNTIIKKLNNQKNKIKINTLIVSRVNCESELLNKKHTIETIHPIDFIKYETIINNVKEHIEFFFKQHKSETLTNKLWKMFHNKLMDPYAQIKLGYSTTVYKSQGSTFPIVMVDYDDIISLSVNDFQLALYTAAGRAGSELILLI